MTAKAAKKGAKSKRNINQNRLIAMSHPVREKCLRLLIERGELSPREVADETGEELSNVSYHMRRLTELDCAEEVRTKPVRGALQHFYIATERHLIETDEWELLDPLVAGDLVSEFMHRIVKDFVISRKAGIVGADENFHITRTPLVLDAEGHREGMEVFERCRLEMSEVEKRSAQRRDQSGEVGTPVSSSLVLFEMPAEPEQAR